MEAQGQPLQIVTLDELIWLFDLILLNYLFLEHLLFDVKSLYKQV